MKIKDFFVGLFWKFKDWQIVKKINDQPEINFIYLPFNRGKIYVDFYIKIGALTESKDQAGIGHLLEHYIANQIKEKENVHLDISARINDNYIIFTLSPNLKDDFKLEIEHFISTILSPDFSQSEMFEYERQSIINETNIEQHNLIQTINRLIEKSRYVDEPNSRSFVDHLQTLSQLNMADLEKYHQEFFLSKNLRIFISCHHWKKELIKLIKDKISIKKISKKVAVFPEPKYSEFRIIIKENQEINGHYSILTFPGLNIKANRKERIILSILVKTLSSFSKNSAYDRIRKKGIYDFYVENWIGIKKGDFAIRSYLSPIQLMEWLKLVPQFLREMKKGEIEQSILDTIKKNWLVDGLNNWRSNNRFDYLSGFILDDEKIISWPEMEKIINSSC
ncbi:MAG: hypothetical protein UV64_C0001G0014 [Parcubacteria group bacterium GW2011_GWC1_43_11b]|nr:MAG: hypothetical protein UV64_C0001G0014 [Parcubacteria group bacterium GW2011_GWC1_43_11b]